MIYFLKTCFLYRKSIQEVISSGHHLIKDDKTEVTRSKREKLKKIGLNHILIYKKKNLKSNPI
jgi:hypothetical protein